MSDSDPDSDPDFIENLLSPDDAVLVLEQTDLLTQSNLPLPAGLRAMAEEAPSSQTRHILHQLADRLEAGESLCEVIAAMQPRLSPVMATLIEQGVEIGRMDLILHWATEQTRRTRAMLGQIWNSLAYSLVISGIAFWIACAMLIFIVPKFNKIFDDFGTELPTVTLMVVELSKFVSRPIIWQVMLIGTPILMLKIFIVLPLLKSQFTVLNWLITQRWSVSVPVLGPLLQMAAISEFCNLMAVFIEARVPMHKGIRLSGLASNNQWLKYSCEELSDELLTGVFSPGSAMELGIPIAVGQILSEKTTTESLVESLRGLSEIYAARVEMNARSLTVILEPLMIVGIVIGLGTGVIAMFLPLFKLLNDLA